MKRIFSLAFFVAVIAAALMATLKLPGITGVVAAVVILFAGAQALVAAFRGNALCATYTNLNDEIFAQKALEGFVTGLMPIRVFSNNFSADAAKKGEGVLVPLIGSLTATTFGGSYAISGGTASVITVSINKHKVVHTGQDDLTAAASSFAQLERFGYQQGQALALAVLQDVFSLLTTANFGLATAVSVVDFQLAQIRRGRYLLNDANVPQAARAAVLDLDPFDNLLGISNFLQANLAGSNETLREGRVGRALGFDIYETNALPGTASVMGFCGHASAIAIASRYLMPQDGHTYRDARPVTDPETGLTMGLRDFYDNATGARFVILESNYGFAVGISQGARLFKRLD